MLAVPKIELSLARGHARDVENDANGSGLLCRNSRHGRHAIEMWSALPYSAL